MTSISGKWFECIQSFLKEKENGMLKRETEKIVVAATTFAEAVDVVIAEFNCYCYDELEIKSITIASYKEVLVSDEEKDACWFKVKVALLTIDEKTMKEKATNVSFLVQADRSETANTYINDIMRKSLQDYRIVSIVETKIVDVVRE